MCSLFFLSVNEKDELSLPEFHYHRFRQKPVMTVTLWVHEPRARKARGEKESTTNNT